MYNSEHKQRAMTAVNMIQSNTSVSMEETINCLKELKEEIEDIITALKDIHDEEEKE